MTKRIGSSIRKTRAILSVSEKGRIPLRKFLQTFNSGDKVAIVNTGAMQGGQAFRRFRNYIGVVKEAQGDCFKVAITDGKKEKLLIVHPVHLKKV